MGSLTERASSATVRNGSFVFTRGKMTVVAVPEAKTITELMGVNNAGVAVGRASSDFFDTSIAYGKGPLRPLTLPNGEPIVVTGINDVSQVIGTFPKGSGQSAGIFKYSGGELATLQHVIAVPGATVTLPTGINNSGQVVGTYATGGVTHAFLYADGLYTTFEVPGATPGSTAPAAVNNKGEIVGSFTAPGNPGLPHGFAEKNGAYTTLDFPGTPGGTQPAGVNDRGVIIGSYHPEGDRLHDVAGFIATPQP